MKEILDNGTEISSSMESILTEAVDTVNNNKMYTTPAFKSGQDARSTLEYAMSDCADADRKTVLERISQGESIEEAVKEFTSDEYFDAWYEKTLSTLQAYEG